MDVMLGCVLWSKKSIWRFRDGWVFPQDTQPNGRSFDDVYSQEVAAALCDLSHNFQRCQVVGEASVPDIHEESVVM